MDDADPANRPAPREARHGVVLVAEHAQRPLGDDGDARAVGDHAHHCRQGRGHRGRRVGAVALAQGQRLVAQAVALVKEQQPLVLELGGGQVIAPGPGVIPGDQDDERLVEHGHGRDAMEIDVDGDDGRVEAALGQHVEDVAGDHLAQLGVQVGQFGGKAVEDHRGHVGGEGRDYSQAHRPGQGGAPAGDGVVEGLGGQNGLPGVGEQGLAQRGDEDATGGALDQLPADAPLQGGDRLGQARLAHAEGGGRLAEVLVVAQRHEGPELGEGGQGGSGHECVLKVSGGRARDRRGPTRWVTLRYPQLIRIVSQAVSRRGDGPAAAPGRRPSQSCAMAC